MKQITNAPHMCKYCGYTNLDKSVVADHEKRCVFNLKEVKNG